MEKGKLIIFISFFIITLVILAGFVYLETTRQKTNSPTIEEARAEIIDIKTNKIKYALGEQVFITITNRLPVGISQDESSDLTIVAIGNLGVNYSVGLIEGYIDDRWKAVEPVWRCDEPCFEECRYENGVSNDETIVFTWDQSRIECDMKGRKEIKFMALPGKYRVSSGIFDSREQRSIIIYSNEFFIE